MFHGFNVQFLNRFRCRWYVSVNLVVRLQLHTQYPCPAFRSFVCMCTLVLKKLFSMYVLRDRTWTSDGASPFFLWNQSLKILIKSSCLLLNVTPRSHISYRNCSRIVGFVGKTYGFSAIRTPL
jgi:hypothetical protein